MAEILQRSLLPSLPAVDGMSLAAQYVPDRVDRLVLGLDAVPMATLLYAQLRRRPGGRSLRWATAGHPPPVVRHHDGTVEVLTAATGLLLGVTDDVLRESRQLDLEVGSILLAFTDGVVERRGEDVSAGMDRVAAVLADADPTDLDALIAAVIATARTDGDDDMAAIAVRLDA